MFNRLTGLQKEYFYVLSIVVANVVLAFLIPSVAWFAFIAAFIGLGAFTYVAVSEGWSSFKLQPKDKSGE